MEIEGPIEDILEVEKLLAAARFELEPRGYPRLSQKHGKLVEGIAESRFAKTTSV